MLQMYNLVKCQMSRKPVEEKEQLYKKDLLGQTKTLKFSMDTRLLRVYTKRSGLKIGLEVRVFKLRDEL